MKDQFQSGPLHGKVNNKEERFSSSGFILAAIGSAVGLGNMWKFPYITGQYGGAAFFMLFVICLLLVGLPVLLAELTVGRGGRGNASTSLIRLSGRKLWGGFGFITILGAFVILSFYAVVAGWTLHYAMLSFTGKLFEHKDYALLFSNFNASWMPVFWQFIVMLLTGFVIIRGVSAGIEKFNKILIPGLVILLLVLCVRALSLEGAGEGVAFFLKPDFSKLSAESALVALGHAFFSLSLGMGAIMTYGAYVDKRQSLGLATLAIGIGDLAYAFLAGLIIFPTTFVYGLEASQGPGLVFVALPAAFSAMPLGAIFGGLFFVLLAFAALTSMISLLEVPVAFVREAFGWSRKFSVVLLTLLCFLVGLPSALSLGDKAPWLTFGGKSFFDWMDFVCSNIVLPLGGLVVTLFVGYAWKGAAEEAGLSTWWLRLWMFMLRYVAPILVLLVFLYSSGILTF
ncbi:sodium-dependent transporter [Paenibacillus sp. PL91]|uniref:sodium-dependent transporter n=1 Tax=Paenibacillus sp. PL91 TaxID=2729538 RepID=UPI00145CC10D|nr:sodium-dependent transporter [Paenibacillus sp. PL91]MBC9201792.1 sodium-dependent transporter [Paenibacillus sp. PL91]